VPLVLGGDHSVALGTLGGLARARGPRRRQRHPVDVPARRGLGAIQVAVRVQPEHAARPAGSCQPAERAQRDRMVAAEYKRHVAAFHRAGDELGDPLIRLLDLRQEPQPLVADRARLCDSGRDVAPVLDTPPEPLDASVEARVADRGGAHVDASPTGAQIERGADDRDRLRGFLNSQRDKASFALPMNNAGQDAPDRIQVLIADDDRSFLESLRDLIDQQPELTVIGAATDGLQAIELAEDLDPDAVVIDLHMPLLDGVTAAARLRRDHPNVCLIALTGDEAPALHRAVRDAGADEVLLKTELVEGLLERLAAARRG
jgi:CheY-like chemotaxis protein